jgi:hypothetical protein
MKETYTLAADELSALRQFSSLQNLLSVDTAFTKQGKILYVDTAYPLQGPNSNVSFNVRKTDTLAALDRARSGIVQGAAV